mgnify:CR=1 FL=1
MHRRILGGCVGIGILLGLYGCQPDPVLATQRNLAFEQLPVAQPKLGNATGPPEAKDALAAARESLAWVEPASLGASHAQSPTPSRRLGVFVTPQRVAFRCRGSAWTQPVRIRHPSGIRERVRPEIAQGGGYCLATLQQLRGQPIESRPATSLDSSDALLALSAGHHPQHNHWRPGHFQRLQERPYTGSVGAWQASSPLEEVSGGVLIDLEGRWVGFTPGTLGRGSSIHLFAPVASQPSAPASGHDTTLDWLAIEQVMAAESAQAWHSARQRLAAWRGASKQPGSRIEALFLEGLYLEYQGDTEGALDRYHQLLAKPMPEKVDASMIWQRKGLLHARRERYPSAIEAYNQALELNSQNVHALAGRGMAEFQQGQLVQAVADLQSALQENPRLWEAWQALGRAYFAQGALDQVYALLKRLQHHSPHQAYRLLHDLMLLGFATEGEQPASSAEASGELQPRQ